ncbi:MAG: hypothetical protein J6B85_13620 [Lachnospiraceae bacterium]|nr:hypothetical protein [Lachnospiraceae bacterium]
MGKIILCSGETAAKPYVFRRMGTRIYSAEELCYYITHNLETIADEIFAEDLADFMEEELKLPERAERFRDLLHRKSGLKDVIVCILCSADYYTEDEIKAVLEQIDEMNSLTPVQRKKRRADNYLKKGNISEAYEEYSAILQSKENAALKSVEYGDVLHNLAVISMGRDRFIQAALYFRDAYERNQNPASLKCYLYALMLAGRKEECEQEAQFYGVEGMDSAELFLELERISLEAEGTTAYYDLLDIRQKKENGDGDYRHALLGLTDQLKEEYRKE